MEIEIPFGAKDSELQEWSYNIPEGYTAEIKDGKVTVRLAKNEDNDERIRKIITLALIASEEELSDFYSVHNITRKECTDWLEKQKTKQKFEWSEEDKKIAETICKEGDLKPSEQRWLKSLPERFNFQLKQEWSEKDETRFNNLCYIIKKAEGWNEVSKNAFIDWLKSFKNRSNFSWKPSEEQMSCLKMVLSSEAMDDNIHTTLTELYEQLKKL